MALAKMYENGFKELMSSGSIDFLSDDIKVMVLWDDVPYVFNEDETDLVTAALSEMTADGYIPGFAGTGRYTLASKTITLDALLHRIVFDADDPVWTIVAGKNVVGFIVYKHDTDDATSIPIAYIEIASTITNGNPAPLKFDPSGIFFIQL